MKPYSVDPIVPAFLSTHLDHQPGKKFEGILIKNATTINESSKLDKRKMSTACVQAKRVGKRARDMKVLKERISIIDHFIATPIEFTCNKQIINVVNLHVLQLENQQSMWH
jgi:hypothetical protein